MGVVSNFCNFNDVSCCCKSGGVRCSLAQYSRQGFVALIQNYQLAWLSFYNEQLRVFCSNL